jgi:hypothetical protein
MMATENNPYFNYRDITWWDRLFGGFLTLRQGADSAINTRSIWDVCWPSATITELPKIKTGA